ncbi:hypothetical protein CP083_00955 [Candidatus Bathyarchaeota archaeon B24-2]|nr:MAG: hypothetical protein CP083_00955 [Candidatus Bathyarchaeota archaeon B24-2]
MTRKEKRRSLFDLFFEDSLLSDVEEIFRRLEEEPLTEGYSINVTQGPEGTKVYVKAGRNTDVEALRREIQQRYPNAEIHIEGGKPLIREVSTTPSEEKEKGKKPSKEGVWFKPE